MSTTKSSSPGGRDIAIIDTTLSTIAFQPSFQSSIDDDLFVATFDDPVDRNRYGYSKLQILATNNKDCLHSGYINGYPPKKHIHGIQNPAFGRAYNERILPGILGILHPSTSSSFVVPQFSELHAVHMVFSDGHELIREFPTVLLVFDVSLGTINTSEAKDLVLKISECIQNHWPRSVGRVYTDICESNVLVTSDARSGSNAQDPRILNPTVYEEKTPRPGASIGNIEYPTSSSTLSFYITNGDKTYATATDHGVFPAKELLKRSAAGFEVSPYDRKNTSSEIKMVSPSGADWQETLDALEIEIEEYKCNEKMFGLSEWKAALRDNPDSIDDFVSSHQVGINSTKEKISLISNFDRILGTVVATSEQLVPTATLFRFDWSVIECDGNKIYSNTYPPQSIVHEDRRALSNTDWLVQMNVKLKAGIRISQELSNEAMSSKTSFVKPSSARTGTRVAKFSDTVSTLYNGRCGITTEWAFSNLPGTPALTVPGDSGSCILSEDGCVVAVAWGGDDNTLRAVDLTYATPAKDLLQDIREKLQWEQVKLLRV
ncbi:hypothetical protein BKA64DRAFT_714347 [Cadophora sp. MPI-SDFR-AT-0126]|nr:hypothetical protein BKA64DRAFT_714347 [Leotiomycetes sp. MPI-SDFR-AT-0126]